MKLKSSCIILLSINSLSVSAEVTLDGTIGRGGTLPGPDYLIGADLGRQHGGNLFHSFQDFNLNRFEIATFSGPNSVSHIISRVTGGNPSNIDGLIRSTIPNADMYFLNPYGIMFGPNARLDVQGSFHASTADYLRLGDGGRFYARYPNDSLLTIAPIEAFGFLTDTPAPITTQNSDLSVFDGNSLSLIGGNLHLNSNSPVMFDEKGFMAVFARSKLSASAGRINLASVASQGEVVPSEFGLDLNAQGGQITADNTLIDVSGRNGGSVFIRGGQLLMRDSVIQASTLADLDGKTVDLQLSESISIEGNLVSIFNLTFGSGDASSLFIKTPILKNTSWIWGGTFSSGKSPDIEIEAEQIWFENGGSITSAVNGNGQSGQLNIKAKKILSLSGRGPDKIKLGFATYENFPSLISTATFTDTKAANLIIETDYLQVDGGIISADSFGGGDASEINIYANKAELTNGALISSTAFAQGNGGQINILIDDTLSISGQRLGKLIIPFGPTLENNDTGINSASFGSGDAGQISVKANTLLVANSADISTATFREGSGGNVVIKSNNLQLTNKASVSSSAGLFYRINLLETSGKGGNVIVQANHLALNKGSSINSTSVGKNDAGNVTVQANTMHLEDRSQISTAARLAAGGNVSIQSPDLLYLRGSEITTSVATGKGSGGNITIENPTFVVMNGSRIIAQADEGQGGNIYIKSEQFLRSNNSLVSASSRLGLDGHIEINSPDENVAEGMLTLSSDTVDTSTMTKKPCEVHSLEEYTNRSSFDSYPIAGSPTSPFDLQPSRFSFQSTKIAPTTSQKQSMTNPHPRQMAVVSVCQPVQPKTQAVKRSRVIPEPPLF